MHRLVYNVLVEDILLTLWLYVLSYWVAWLSGALLWLKILIVHHISFGYICVLGLFEFSDACFVKLYNRKSIFHFRSYECAYIRVDKSLDKPVGLMPIVIVCYCI